MRGELVYWLGMLWLWADGVEGEIAWQTHLGEELGGSNPYRTGV